MSERMTFAIGDIHGCLEELRSLLDACRKSAGDIEHDFLFLGDYVDRGPASDEVITCLMREQASAPSRFRCLLGNHDHMLCLAADRSRSDADLIQWWANGGEETLDAYGIDDPSGLPAEHLAWMRALPLQIRDEHRLFVHAGVRPGVPLEAQSKDDMLWIREPFLSSRLWHGALVVHGHTPTATRAPDVQANRVNLDTGACFGGPLTAAAFSSVQSGHRQEELRPDDIHLRIPWSAYETPYIRLRQSKGGRRVAMPAGAPLRALLDTTSRRGPLILTNTLGRPWTSDGFRTSWAKACERAGIDGLTFHDLRGTAVVRLAIAGASVPQIAAVTGHSLKDVEAILDAHYLGRDIQLAEAAVLKLEARTKL